MTAKRNEAGVGLAVGGAAVSLGAAVGEGTAVTEIGALSVSVGRGCVTWRAVGEAGVPVKGPSRQAKAASRVKITSAAR
jgi:hypothetical protein